MVKATLVKEWRIKEGAVHLPPGTLVEISELKEKQLEEAKIIENRKRTVKEVKDGNSGED